MMRTDAHPSDLARRALPGTACEKAARTKGRSLGPDSNPRARALGPGCPLKHLSSDFADGVCPTDRNGLRVKLIAATHSPNLSAGDWLSSVFLGRSLSCLAMALSRGWL
jgi:hypothetical protein